MIKCKMLFEKIDELQKEYIDFWTDISSIESPTDYKEGVDCVGKYIIEKSIKYGWQVEVQKQKLSGDCICITMNSQAKKAPVCLSGHMDTVHPVGLFGSPAVTKDDEKIYGPGVADCKGGIAAAFMAMAALQDIGFSNRPVKLILQSDEETSSAGSNKTTVAFMCDCAKGAAAFLNCEPSLNNTVVLQRKGILKYKLEITGHAAHAGMCYDGVSAVLEAAHKIIELENKKDKNGITCNCGIVSGGTAVNTVPEKCEIFVDVRFSDSKQLKEAQEFVEDIAYKSFVEGTKCILTLESLREAMELKQENLDLLEKANTIYAENGLPELTWRAAGGGSDAAYTTQCGVPTLDSIGVEYGAIHSKDEYAVLASITESAKRLAAICYSIE